MTEQTEKHYKDGIFGAIEHLGFLNKGKTDKETHKVVKQLITAIREHKRSEYPDKEIRRIVNGMHKTSRKMFLDVLVEMDLALTEHYGDSNGKD